MYGAKAKAAASEKWNEMWENLGLNKQTDGSGRLCNVDQVSGAEYMPTWRGGASAKVAIDSFAELDGCLKMLGFFARCDLGHGATNSVSGRSVFLLIRCSTCRGVLGAGEVLHALREK
eukprot:gene14443-biopygen15667